MVLTIDRVNSLYHRSVEQTSSNLNMKLILQFYLQSLCIGFCGAFLVAGDGCGNPPAAKNFQNEKYYGLWYELGKIQTAGGAYFEKECVCTTIDVQPDPRSNNGDASAVNSCRKLSPEGQFLNATGTLSDEQVPGHWKEGFFPLAPKADYRIIYLDDNMAIEYDCSSVFGLFTNYCIHILSRSPQADNATLTKLVQFAESLGLNPQNLPYQETLQIGCWS